MMHELVRMLYDVLNALLDVVNVLWFEAPWT